MKISLLAIILVFAAVQGPPPTPPAAPLDAAHCKCSIEVVVKRVATGEPIPDVELQLRFANPADPRSLFENFPVYAGGPVSVRTGGSGRAEFRDLPEGEYAVFAQRHGDFFFGANSGGFGNNTVQTSVHVGPKYQLIQQVSFTMMTGGKVSGRILDAKHQPVHIGISAYHVEYRDGQRTLVASLAEETDERGEYHLTQLPAGEYYVRTVTTAPQQNQTYYPGVLGPKSAIPVDVHEGEEIHGIDFAIPAETGVTISGTIINTFPGGDAQPDGKVLRAISSLYLVPRNTGFYFDFPQAVANTAKENSNTNNGTEFPFEIHNVPPGTYDLYPLFVDTATGHINSFTSPTRIEVATEDLREIKAVIRGGTTLRVRVVREGVTLPPVELRNAPASLSPDLPEDLLAAFRQERLRSLTALQLRVIPKDSQPSLIPGDRGFRSLSVPLNGGEGAILDMIAGSYLVSIPSPRFSGLSGSDPNLFVADLRLGTRSVFDDGAFTLSEDTSAPLDVIIRSGGGTIQGKVDYNGPAPGSSSFPVKLIPDPPRRQNLMLYQTVNVRLDANGSFTFTNIAPGTYKLFAWESLPAGAEQNAEFIGKYESRGVSVTVSPGLTLSNIKVPLIR